MNALWEYSFSVFLTLQFWHAVIFLTASLTVIMVGLVFIGLQLYMRQRGYRVQGRVIGAVLQQKLQQHTTKKNSAAESTLYVVYEYTNRNGQLKQEISSEGGDFVKNLQTGQTVRLVVCPSSSAYDDVYLDHWQPAILGLCIALVGGLFTYLTLQHFGWQWEVATGAGLVLLFGAARLYVRVHKHRHLSDQRPPSKCYLPQDVVPVETAFTAYKAQRTSHP